MSDNVDDLIRQLRDLEIQQAALVRRLSAARTRERAARDAKTARVPHTNFCIGDRVEITNGMKGLFGRSVTINDRRGTVTKLTSQHVIIQTFNGATVYRAPANVRRISEAN